MVQVLEGESAVTRHREIMGATDPKKAAPSIVPGRVGQDQAAAGFEFDGDASARRP
jgi:nucleoside diphosphate kinase